MHQGAGAEDSDEAKAASAGEASGGAGAEAPRFETKLQRAYRTLELEDQAPLSLVKKQYRKLVFKNHPDHIKNYMELDERLKADITRHLQEIVQAYAYIMRIVEDKDEDVLHSASATS